MTVMIREEEGAAISVYDAMGALGEHKSAHRELSVRATGKHKVRTRLVTAMHS